jgi:hypothetical protein
MEYKCGECGYKWNRLETGKARYCQRCGSDRIARTGSGLTGKLLARLKEFNLPVPAILTIPQKPSFIPDDAAHLIYTFPTSIISVEKLLDLMVVNGKNVINTLNPANMQDVVDVPNTSCFCWVNDGRYRLGVSSQDAEKGFATGEAGATALTGLWLLFYYPEILKNHGIDLPGSRYRHDAVPCLSAWDGTLKFFFSYVGEAYSLFGSASCGSAAQSLNP